MALARAEALSFWYPGQLEPALAEASLELAPGEVVALLGASGSGKSTLLRAFAGLVPHFHGGRFRGRVTVDGRDTRTTRPAELAGLVASVFQDPEDQVVLTRVVNEVTFGLENLGTPPAQIMPHALEALAWVDAVHLAERDVRELSSGELQRVCLASALALAPRLLLLDEPTSQLDPHAADGLLELVEALARDRGVAVLVSEQRPARVLDVCDRAVFVERGRVVLDAPRDHAVSWLARRRPAYVEQSPDFVERSAGGETVCRLDGVTYSYGGAAPAVDRVDLEVRRGEVVVLTGPNGAGKTTVAKLATGLLEAAAGRVERAGRAAYLSQDPGRYLVRERVEEEVALGVGGDLRRARAALSLVGLEGFATRHPRDLSSGERERLGLSAVLVTEPDFLALDEPTRGVDPERKEELADFLRRGAPDRGTLVVTHDLGFAASVTDRRVELGALPQAVHV